MEVNGTLNGVNRRVARVIMRMRNKTRSLCHVIAWARSRKCSLSHPPTPGSIMLLTLSLSRDIPMQAQVIPSETLSRITTTFRLIHCYQA